MLAVTAGPPACRIAATAAAWSTSAISSPPNRSPSTFCMCGMTKVVIVTDRVGHGTRRRRGRRGKSTSAFSALSAFSAFLVVHRPEIVLADRRRAQHGDGGQPALPVGGVEALRTRSISASAKPSAAISGWR